MKKIKINGKVYETFKDHEGVLRFKPNNLILKLKIHFELNMSEVVRLMYLGAITPIDLLDYYTGIGFAVSGVQELSFFKEFEWEEGD